jgi:DNA-binding NtrC family response regulator
MMYESLQGGQINVLVSEADWAWPMAVREIFLPRGVSMMLARRPEDVLDIMQQRRIHTAIVDMDSDDFSGPGVIRIIKACNPLLPCILLAKTVEQKVLSKALEMEVFSVIGKPVDFDVLLGQLDRLFTRRYNCDVFSAIRKE